ncbi:MAG: YfbK domain-containing protein, partial [Candidatus Sericytochromatia bacterium]
LEARKVLVQEMGGTLQTIAKDVKLQLEFNPAKVASYRLIGYENRLLRNEDFEDDTKDAGELGAGTTVTALYEIVPGTGKGPDLRYQQTTVRPEAQGSNELLTVKLRYKPPTADTSKLLSQVVQDQPQAWTAVPADFRFAAAVAGFGMQLRKSEFKGAWNMEDVIAQARQGLGDDTEGYRAAFVTLAQKSQSLVSASPETTR